MAHVSERRAGSACYDARHLKTSNQNVFLSHSICARGMIRCATIMVRGRDIRRHRMRNDTSTWSFRIEGYGRYLLTDEKEKVRVVLVQSGSEIVSTARVSSDMASDP